MKQLTHRFAPGTALAHLAKWAIRLAVPATAAAFAQPAMCQGAPRAVQNEVDLVALRAACSAPDDAAPILKGIRVERMEGAQNDLAYLLVTNESSKSTVRIYFEPEFEQAAKARAACFGGIVSLVENLSPDLGVHVAWAPIVLAKKGYLPPHRDGEVRWIAPSFTGHWDAEATKFLVLTMPHEETHILQRAFRTNLQPRWFQEGHAEWVGLKVTEQIRPDIESDRRAELNRSNAALPEHHLAAWGGMRVKPEAILRQLSPEDRARQERDPTFNPPGPFSFGPGDFMEDNSDLTGRYASAHAIFESLERANGTPAVQGWILAVMKAPDGKKQVVPLAKEVLGQDLTPALK